EIVRGHLIAPPGVDGRSRRWGGRRRIGRSGRSGRRGAPLDRIEQALDFSLAKNVARHGCFLAKVYTRAWVSRVSSQSSTRGGRCPPYGWSFAHLTGSVDHVLVTGQLLDTAGAAGVQLIGADADLGPQPELITVIEPRAGVDHHGRAVDACGEFAGRRQVGRDDRVGVLRAIAVDVADRLVERIDNLDRKG